MYKITVQTLIGDEHTIYVPGNEEYTVISAVLSLSAGSAGEFNFTVPLGNPRYDEIVDHSIITIYEDNHEIWRGEIKDIKVNFDKSLNVYCLEDLSWLGDAAVAMIAINNQTYAQRFSAAIATYNENQVAKRQFTAGMLTSITTSNICTWQPQYGEDLLTCLRNYIADDGLVRIRREYSGGALTRYVDIVRLEDYGQQADQKIEFGSNLLDFVKEIDDTNFLNVIYPYGKETETPLYGETMQRMVGTPIENAESIAAFGRRERSVVFETESLAKLNSLALSYLNRYSQPSMKIEIKAIDLGNIEAVSRIHLGDSVRIIAKPFAIDQWSYTTKQELDLLDIANNQITLSDSVRVQSLTSQVIEQAKDIEDIRTPASVLDEAKRNALAIFEGDNGGIITFPMNDQNQIIGILCANNLDINQATKAIGLNISGLVLMSRTYPSDEWTLGVGITINGAIVADYITTGEMSADRINGGHIRAELITSLNGSTAVGLNTLNDFLVDSDLNQTNVFNRLIGGDTEQGIVLNNGKIYLRGEYLEAGAITIGGSAFADNPTLLIKDISNNTTGSLTKDGIDVNKGVFGNTIIENGELYNTGSLTIGEKVRKFSNGSNASIYYSFKPNNLRLKADTFEVSVTYSVSGNTPYAYGILYLEHYENSAWFPKVSQNITIADGGTYTIALDYSISSSDTSSWRVRIGRFGQMTAYTIEMTVFIPVTKTVSISNDGLYGAFHGTCDGIAAFKKIDVPELTTNELMIDSSGLDYISSDGEDIHRWDYDSQTDYTVRWQSSSDRRMKEDIETLDAEISKSLIDATEPKRFRFKNRNERHYGMIAQEVREILNDLGEDDAHLEFSLGDRNIDDQRAIEYEEYIPHLINYVKLLRAEISALKNIINI